jgi:Fe-S-cluster containining protein
VDIESRDRRDGAVELRDPRLLRIFTVSAADLGVARAFDGCADAASLARRLGLEASQVASIAEAFLERHLLDTPEAAREVPVHDTVPVPSLLGGQAGLQGPPLAEAGARWACHACGRCCRGLVVELTPAEDARIDPARYADLLGGAPYAEETFVSPAEPARRVLRHKSATDDRCIFLLDDGRCAIHARQGGEHKPNACRLFPFLLVQVPRRPPRLGLRLSCDSMWRTAHASPGVSAHQEPLGALAEAIEVQRAPANVELFGAQISFAAYDRWAAELGAALDEGGATPASIRAADRRLLGGRVRRSRRRFGRRMSAYAARDGSYRAALSRALGAAEALERMGRGEPAPEPEPALAGFLHRQLRHAIWSCGPLNPPDAGYGAVALVLALEATLHTTSADLALANRAFDAFTAPLLETLEHFWPVLEAIDLQYARQIQEEMS